jgi:hypothetical protein
MDATESPADSGLKRGSVVYKCIVIRILKRFGRIGVDDILIFINVVQAVEILSCLDGLSQGRPPAYCICGFKACVETTAVNPLLPLKVCIGTGSRDCQRTKRDRCNEKACLRQLLKSGFLVGVRLKVLLVLAKHIGPCVAIERREFCP